MNAQRTITLQAYYDSIVYRDIIRVNEIRNQKALAEACSIISSPISRPPIHIAGLKTYLE